MHYVGVHFEPLMRPLFNVPGMESFVFSMGLAADCPMDLQQEVCGCHRAQHLAHGPALNLLSIGAKPTVDELQGIDRGQ
ncbi:MAG: hypothetical protein M1493_01525 [Firmicutes bacterium]|nr:hypothetical protein [Bacillota bacterium]